MSRTALSFICRWFSSAALLMLVIGCASRPELSESARAFDFSRDVFAFNNELRSTYAFDPDGRWVRTKISPTPEFTLRCFPVAKAARQFFDHATFDAQASKVGADQYRRLIEEVLSRSSRDQSSLRARVIIPGYGSLREFSVDQERLLKRACDGPVESYTQRGHWRMVFSFSRSGQVKRADAMASRVAKGRPVIAHVVDFPSLYINHAVLLIGVEKCDEGYRFAAYDPNDSSHPTVLLFDLASRTFQFPQTPYFRGGTVDAYEVYRDWLY